jgi:protein-serine/threonine kinase
MLAGYLPFDDDPANPEGDNINLLYKYIVSTPLTFPEYVTPHARDLLKRILVPDPRKRADLFEVARHSWLADYSHVVGFITSSSPTTNDAQQASVYSSSKSCTSHCMEQTDIVIEDTFEQQPPLARSASVREPGKPHAAPTPAHGGLTAKREQINSPPSEKPKTTRDNKRRTVQVEYVAPQSQTVRGETSQPIEPAAAGSSQSRVRNEEPTEVPRTDGYSSSASAKQGRSAGPATVARPRQEAQRSASDYTAFGTAPNSSGARPSTGGALGAGTRLPSRGNSYGQPSAATVAQTNAEGRFSQPKGKQYSISAPYVHPDAAGDLDETIGQPSTQRGHSIQLGPSGAHGKGGHRRSNTVTETLGRMTSMFSGRQPSYSQDPKGSMTSQNSYANYPEDKKQKNYPPTSMAGPMSNDAIVTPRKSTESSRRSFGFARRNTNTSGETGKPSRRFSLLPSSLSKTFSGQRESMPARYSERRESSARPRGSSKGGMAFGRGDSRSPSQSTTGTGSMRPGFYDGQHDSSSRIRNTHAVPGPSSAPPNQTQFDYPTAGPVGDEKFPNPRDPHPSIQGRPTRHATDDSEFEDAQQYNHNPPYPQGMGGDDDHAQQRKGVLQKSRKFQDAYDGDGGNKGSSGSSKRVMDFFRRMGKQRTGGPNGSR